MYFMNLQKRVVVGRCVLVQPEDGRYVRRFIKTIGNGVEGDEVYAPEEAAELGLRLIRCASHVGKVPDEVIADLRWLLQVLDGGKPAPRRQ